MIYLDNNATTRVADEVVAAMQPYWSDHYANPSSPFAAGRRAARAVGEARERVADALGADAGQIVFTGGGTESLNAAIHMACARHSDRREIVVSSAEHPAVLEPVRRLAAQGYTVHFAPVRSSGELDRESAEGLLSDRTALVCVMAANNETGVVFDTAALFDAAHARGASVLCDATQALGKIPFCAIESGADFVAAASHKLHGPKGVGVLACMDPSPVTPFLLGGGQELGRRAGTENVAGMVGFGAAAALAVRHLPAMAGRVGGLRDRLEAGLRAAAGEVRVLGGSARRLPNTSYILFPGVDAEALIARLDLEGICCSAGSACMAGGVEPSHVLRTMGVGEPDLRSVIRFSAGRYTTAEEIERVIDRVPRCIAAIAAAA